MSFKKNKYTVLKNVISKDVADMAYSYFLNKRKVARVLFDERQINTYINGQHSQSLFVLFSPSSSPQSLDPRADPYFPLNTLPFGPTMVVPRGTSCTNTALEPILQSSATFTFPNMLALLPTTTRLPNFGCLSPLIFPVPPNVTP